ncbi:hypothetical protein BDN70DRAFT_797752 [Pholiota conissans]|uniref:EF-hand domain-containing protein n=1 Tax=Pholiota conissans TaxID=109636 RepID=A0A9P6CXV2_9AGAR|nr:hypothetical protein BDN70DRAFT_797752 [Pholiota conissans]
MSNKKEDWRTPAVKVEEKNQPKTFDFVERNPLLSQEEILDKRKHDYDTDSNSTTDTDTYDEFDWSEGETPQKSQPEVRAKRGRRLWLSFMKLARPVRVLLVGFLGSAICITPLVVVHVRFNQSVVKMQVHMWSLWLAITWAAACMTSLLVGFIPRLVVAVTRLFGGNTERLKIQVDLTLAVKAWLKLLLDTTWGWITLSILRTVYNPPGLYWTIINRVMQALFSASVIIFIEKVFLQFVAINFHQKALADRIAENQLGLKALDRLSNAQSSPTTRKTQNPKHRIGEINESSAMNGHNISTQNAPKSFATKSSKHPKRKKQPMTSVIVDQVGDAIGQITLKNSKFHQQGDLACLYSARKLARKLFSALSNVDPPRSHLIVDDFYPYFRTTVEAHDAFALFDKDGNGDISKPEMRDAVQRIYRERKELAAGLKDVGSIVAKLDGVLLCVALVVIIFLALLIFNRSNTLASLVPLATVVLGFSFIFGNSAATLFESLIFIFSTHVFDVGDLVMIDDQVLFVKEFGLFSTVFRRVDGQEVIAPNSLLSSTKLVHNLRRSKSMWESTILMVAYDTPMEVIEQLKGKIVDYVASNSREWSNCALNIDKMEYQNAIHLNVAMEHRPNWQDWGGRWTRRTTFMRYLKTVLEELDLRYTMPIQPVILPQGNRLQRSPSHLQPPASGRNTVDSSMFSSAGFFQGGEYGRPSGPVFKDGVPMF